MKEPTFDEILGGYEKKLETSYSISDLEKRRDYLTNVLKELHEDRHLSVLQHENLYINMDALEAIAELNEKLLKARYEANLESKVGLSEKEKSSLRIYFIMTGRWLRDTKQVS